MSNSFKTYFGRFFSLLVAGALMAIAPMSAGQVLAAGGIYAGGGGNFTVGEKFTITVTAKGVRFNSLEGVISVSGPVEVLGFAPGSAQWVKEPANNQRFVGTFLGGSSDNFTVARITLRGTKEGSGGVSVNGAKLVHEGKIVSTDSGGANFSIGRAPQPPGQIKISSPSHPDQGVAYENRDITLQWDKPAGVSEFSYLLDQSAGTVPATKADGAGTSVSYTGKEIGTYYFHIRAKNGDGWGPASHFKITIKEPDPKINDELTKPVIAAIRKAKNFQTNVSEGTLSGITLYGTGQPDFKLNLNFTPKPGDIPAEAFSTTIDPTGAWQITFDQPLKAGFYTLTAQGQQDKTLTAMSEEVKVELSVAKGGNVQFITAKDVIPSPTPTPSPSPVPVKGLFGNSSTPAILAGLLFAVLATGGVGLFIWWRNRTK